MTSLLVETSSNRCQKVIGKCSESFQNGKMCHISPAEHSRIYHLSLIATVYTVHAARSTAGGTNSTVSSLYPSVKDDTFVVNRSTIKS